VWYWPLGVPLIGCDKRPVWIRIFFSLLLCLLVYNVLSTFCRQCLPKKVCIQLMFQCVEAQFCVIEIGLGYISYCTQQRCVFSSMSVCCKATRAFTRVGWQVTLCDCIWQVTLCSSVTGSHKKLYTRLTYFYFHQVNRANGGAVILFSSDVYPIVYQMCCLLLRVL